MQCCNWTRRQHATSNLWGASDRGSNLDCSNEHLGGGGLGGGGLQAATDRIGAQRIRQHVQHLQDLTAKQHSGHGSSFS